MAKVALTYTHAYMSVSLDPILNLLGRRKKEKSVVKTNVDGKVKTATKLYLISDFGIQPSGKKRS